MLNSYIDSLPPGLLSPWALALLGLAVGSFLNVVVHRLPLMLERQWWGDVAAQLADGDSYQRVFAAAAPERLAQAGGALGKSLVALPPLNLARPASRCPSCGHRIRWYENLPGAQLAGAARAAARPAARASRCATRWWNSATGAALRRRGLARGAAAGRRCCGAAWRRRCWRWR